MHVVQQGAVHHFVHRQEQKQRRLNKKITEKKVSVYVKNKNNLEKLTFFHRGQSGKELQKAPQSNQQHGQDDL